MKESTPFFLFFQDQIFRYVCLSVQKIAQLKVSLIIFAKQESPCIMCVQYIGGCSVHRGVFSTSGGYHEYIGGYHEYIGGYHDECGGIP